MAEARRGFQVPPEVPRYFADRGMTPRFSYLDVWLEEHAHSFTVAKAVDLELLTTFHRSIAEAIQRGEGFETWQKGLQPQLEKLGWWRPRRVADPTGMHPGAMVDFSSPRRLQTIFWSNMRSARAAGQWERAQRTKKALPYFVYVRTTSGDPRKEHLAWVGIILPVDHPFWRTHFPPNGWHCKCAVRQITAREAERLLASGKYLDTPPPIEMAPFANRRTGEIMQVPHGIDPGWGHNPGLSRAHTLMDGLRGRLEDAGEAVARRSIGELWASPVPRTYMSLPDRVSLPAALSTGVQEQLKARSPLIMISTDTISIKAGKHKNFSLESAVRLQEMIDTGDIVDEGRGEDQRSVLIAEGKRVWKIVIKRSRAGYMRISTVHEIKARRAMRLKDESDRRS